MAWPCIQCVTAREVYKLHGARDVDAGRQRRMLLVESVYRFEGQSAPAVVFAELAFDALNAQEKKKLFVGLTRAHMAVEIVPTAAAEQILLAAIDADNTP